MLLEPPAKCRRVLELAYLEVVHIRPPVWDHTLEFDSKPTRSRRQPRRTAPSRPVTSAARSSW